MECRYGCTLLIVKPRFSNSKMNDKIDKFLLEILCCPSCKGQLKQDSRKSVLECTKCRKSYKIKEGIPHMILSRGMIKKEG